MQQQDPIWNLGSFAAQFGDRYIAGTALQKGHIANSMAFVKQVTDRIIKSFERDGSHGCLGLMDKHGIESLKASLNDLMSARELAAAQPKEASDVVNVVTKTTAAIEKLRVGEHLFVPGGWTGLREGCVLLHIVEKTEGGNYSFVTCNSTASQFHPSLPNRDKIKYKASIRINNIPLSKLRNPVFWTIMFTQWMKEPGEYHKGQIVYDVLLPWLAGSLLPTALQQSKGDPCAEFITPDRSSTNYYGAVIEGLRYTLRHRGWSKEQWKQFSYALRREIISKVREDLLVLNDPEGSLQDGLVLGFNKPPSPTHVGTLTTDAQAIVYNKQYIKNDGSTVAGSTLTNSTIGVLFSGSWCNPCKQFLPLLIYAYNTIKQRHPDFTLIFVSRCKTKEEFDAYFKSMPEEWLAIPYDSEDRREKIQSMFQIRGIPTLAILMGNLVATMDGVAAVRQDRDCEAFPWTPAALAAAQAAKGPPTLEHHEVMLIRWACESMAQKALKEQVAGRLTIDGLRELQAQVDRIRNLTLSLPGGKVFDNLASVATHPQPVVNAEAKVGATPFVRCDLLANYDSVSHYTGESFTPAPPKPVNLISLPEKVSSAAIALQAMKEYYAACTALLDRARDTSTTSRLVLQYEVIVLIGELFTRVIPQPKGFYSYEDAQQLSNDIWASPLHKEVQLALLEQVYFFALTYGMMWQAVEVCPRSSDCERTIVTMCMFTLFDAILRRPAGDVPLVLSIALSEANGYKLSDTMCQNNVDFMEIAAKLEVLHPHMAHSRDLALNYMNKVNTSCRRELLKLRQPDQIEVQKYGETLLFVRGLVERLGYEVMPRNRQRPPSEIEVLTEWFCGENTDLAKDHPEWAMTRDMVAIFKFLATMDTSEAELMRQRKNKQPFMWWKLSFEDGGRRGWWGRLRGKPLAWNVVNFRGSDMDRADIEVLGFGDRKLIFGEGPASHSPADVDGMLSLEYPSEDDILHCDNLPTFGNTLSREESEQLMSYLTVDYMRIPLVLGFFASKDRVTYLFNKQLQAMVRAVLFEGRHWVPNNQKKPINKVPLRFTKIQAEEQRVREMLGARKEEQAELGTHRGLLYNEILMSPQACMVPFLQMLKGTKPLQHASVYSKDANFLCYITLLAIDMEAYLRYVRKDVADDIECRPFFEKKEVLATLDGYIEEMGVFLRKEMAKVFDLWSSETEEKGDIVTSCVVMSYQCLLYSNLSASEDMSDLELVQFLSGFLYVRNWHGFGLGMLASQIDVDSDETGGLTSEDRLVRFLQAYGVNTERLKKKDLQKYLKGKPLYLHVGGQTVRAPTLAHPSGNSNFPPADVPEHRIFTVYNAQRRDICSKFQQYFVSGHMPTVLKQVLRIALRSPEFSDSTWVANGPGCYIAKESDLRIDFQTGEILWRNDDLQPVPDSIAQFSDYQALFKDKVLHCGVVTRQAHRFWVHIVGTKFDLIEWDEPDAHDQGVGCPEPCETEGQEDEPGDSEGTENHVSSGDDTIDNSHNSHTSSSTIVQEQSSEVRPGMHLSAILEALQAERGNLDNLDPQDFTNTFLRQQIGSNRFSTTTTSTSGTTTTTTTTTTTSSMSPLSRGVRRVGAIRSRNQVHDSSEMAVNISWATKFLFNGKVWDRAIDIYDERPHLGLEDPNEQWIADVLQPIMLASFPPFPPENKMEYNLVLPHDHYDSTCEIARLVGCSGNNKEHATWKEVVVYKHRKLVHMYNLVSHGRKMYRVLIYTSHHGYCLDALSPNFDPKAAPPPPFASKQAGRMKLQRRNIPSLIISRVNKSIGGHELLLPKRLLGGLLPSALLSSHRFYHGKDGVIRGSPIVEDESDEWFNFRVEVHLVKNGQGEVVAHLKKFPSHSPLTSYLPSTENASSSLPSDIAMRSSTGQVEGNNMFARQISQDPSSIEKDDADDADDANDANDAGDDDDDVDDNTTADVPSSKDMATKQQNKKHVAHYDSEAIANLVGMTGQSIPAVKYALRRMHHDTSGAARWLMDEDHKKTIEEIDDKEAQIASEKNAKNMLDALLELEVDPIEARYATMVNRTLQECLDWLQKDANRALAHAAAENTLPLNLARSISTDESNALTSSSTMDIREDASSEPAVCTGTLLNLLDAAKDTFLFRLASLLVRIEDLSHVLVWTQTDVDHTLPVPSTCEIDVIELPRLKLKMKPQRLADGKSRLCLLEHAGWYVSDMLESYEHHETSTGGNAQDDLDALFMDVDGEAQEAVLEYKHLHQLVKGIEHSLLLENGTGGFMVLVPNHDIHRLPLQGQPFPTKVLADRSSIGWQTTMDTRYYLYPIHQSHQHMICSTLASTLYLILVRLLCRDYTEAFLLANTVFTDTSFDDEEAWIFDQFERTLDDQHPEAHACRIKLALAVMYSDNTFKWDMQSELADYLSKKSAVRAACRLTAEEEFTSTTIAKSLTQVLKNRFSLLEKTYSARARKHPPTATSTVTMKPAPLRWGGLPWGKLQTITLDYVAKATNPITRLQFSHPGASPGQLTTEEVVGLLWDETMIADEESGSSRQLGLVFLYQLVRGLIRCEFSGRDVTDEMATLLTRMFQLKTARWGEGTKSGETEIVLTKQMAMLSCMMQSPDAFWPEIPMDDISKRFLARGINLYDPQGRMTEVKNWLDMADMTFRSVMTDPMKAIFISSQIDEFASIRSTLEDNARVVSVLLTSLERQPLFLSNTSQVSRGLSPFEAEAAGGGMLKLGKEDIVQFASRPLGDVAASMVTWQDRDDEAKSKAPFELREHPSASTSVSKELLDRLDDDVALFAEMHNKEKVPVLQGLTISELTEMFDACSSSSSGSAAFEEHLEEKLAELHKLLAAVRALFEGDCTFVERGAETIQEMANKVIPIKEQELPRRLFNLMTFAGQRPPITVQFVISALMSSCEEQDLKRANPFLENIPLLMSLAAATALFTNRASYTKIVIASIESAISRVNALLEEVILSGSSEFINNTNTNTNTNNTNSNSNSGDNTINGSNSGREVTSAIKKAITRVGQDQAQLAMLITAARHYFKDVASLSSGSGDTNSRKNDSLFEYDPRFLLGEYMFEIVLRKRQVEIVKEMAQSAFDKSSKVQQMIMGAGKTTVVGPMLSLILADGESLVVQVMPTALLEQTRRILRSRFSFIAVKKIFTLSFDRSIDDLEKIHELYSKIESARINRDLVCAAPEAIKSLMLKSVESLERLDSFDFSTLKPNESLRNNKEVSRLRDQLSNRSDVADSVFKLLNIIKEQGVLIMDEVDVILNPLKSELNFPIGATSSMPGYRWDLPMHLIDAFFFRNTHSLCEAEFEHLDDNKMGISVGIVLDELEAVLNEGVRKSYLQKEPHVVLLSRAYYWDHIRPIIAKLCYLWLNQGWANEEVNVNHMHVMEFLLEGNTISDDMKHDLEQGLSKESLRLLNLASDWTRTLFCHCITKINRVSYGLLRTVDLARLDARTPKSRKLMSVPFVGKDVPSRSSEFAHPDVLIGLSVLAYRYEGLRKSDLKRMVVQLKQDLSRQVGPREKRPASVLFQSWLDAARNLLEQQLTKTSTKTLTTTTTTTTTKPKTATGIMDMSADELSEGVDAVSSGPGELPGLRRTSSSYAKKEHELEEEDANDGDDGDDDDEDEDEDNNVDDGTIARKKAKREEKKSKKAAHLQSKIDSLDKVLPLPLFQPSDPIQMKRLFRLLRFLPQSCFYYLRQHVFPSVMRSQALKISASGVDLGSSILFGKARLGFSGTPNNLMPEELGKCEYEPGSDGKIIHVLTSPSVTTASVKENWTAKSLLRDIATSSPPFHALIDTGALITGFNNYQAARFLMDHLPEHMEGVVFLDRSDRQMILLRNSGRCLPLSQCGVKPENRFTFYDQIHTTGMDIKQAPNARAVLTIGKDMTFRDYAQGAFRMRGIGHGQTIHLYIISEVMQLLKQELLSVTNQPELDIPSWLLVNSMNATSLQYCKLGLQEIHNVWRQRALNSLREEALTSEDNGLVRMRRFMHAEGDEQKKWMKLCIEKFREKIGFPLPDHIPTPQHFGDKLRSLRDDNNRFADTPQAEAAVGRIISRIEQVSALHVEQTEGGLDSEVVHENEAEAEEEAEEETEQEEEKMSAYTRDDEQQVEWKADVLTRTPILKLGGEEPFYRVCDFHVREEQPTLHFPEDMLLTDNFFRPRWIGIGDRRLKNVAVVLEWRPGASKGVVKEEIKKQFAILVKQGGVAPNVAAKTAIASAMQVLQDVVARTGSDSDPSASYFVALSLSEAETIRRIIHSNQALLKIAAVALWTTDGLQLDANHLFVKLSTGGNKAFDTTQHRNRALTCYRFINNEMFYSDEEIMMLLEALSKSRVVDREGFFADCLRLRRRERNRWADTPLAKVLTEKSAWHLLSGRAKLDQFNAALQASPRIDFMAACIKHDTDQDQILSLSEVQQLLEGLRLGFSPRDVSDIISVITKAGENEMTFEELRTAFYVVEKAPEETNRNAGDEEQAWQCQNCTFVNNISDKTCAMCEFGWTGERECPAGKWTCSGCTLFNSNSLYYCDMCGKVRPNLSFVRF